MSKLPGKAQAAGQGGGAPSPRVAVIDLLRADHRRLGKAFRDFEKLDMGHQPKKSRALVARAIDMLQTHARIKMLLVYPSLRSDPMLASRLDEAVAEHAAMDELAQELQDMGDHDPRFVPRVRVLGEYLRHHAEAEEQELLATADPKLIDWSALNAALRVAHARRPNRAAANSDSADGGITRNGRPLAAPGSDESTRKR